MSGHNNFYKCIVSMYVASCVLREFCPVLTVAFYYKTVDHYESGTTVLSSLFIMEAMFSSALEFLS